MQYSISHVETMQMAFNQILGVMRERVVDMVLH